jgi:hypothetical protein
MNQERLTVAVTHEELRVLNVALDSIAKHADVGRRVYAGDPRDISLINAVAGRVRAMHDSVKGWKKI